MNFFPKNGHTIPLVLLIWWAGVFFIGACDKTTKNVERVGSVEGQLVIGFLSEHDDTESIHKELKQILPQHYRFDSYERLFSIPQENAGFEHVIQLNFENSPHSVSEWQHLIDQVSSVTFVSPNYQYQGQGLEQGEPLRSVQLKSGESFHLDTIQAWEAWQVTKGDPKIVVAITDDGFDFEHENLQGSFWINDKETGIADDLTDRRYNYRDDDQNQYIDDFRGWDFTQSGDNDPSPENHVFFGLSHHGTHIAGIIGAKHQNGIGIKGIAPDAKVMALRFSGSGVWTSIGVARSYQYAADNGARIISTSYAIDQYVDDPIYRAAIRYAYAKGLMIFNSAGNDGIANPRRQEIEEILLVANTYAHPTKRDQLHEHSNYGMGIDLVAPGDIISTIPQNQYLYLEGTSMATPVAASVAALIWSQNPSWTREQVAARLLGTADSVDHYNPSLRGQLGAGRVNAYRALTTLPDPPQLALERSRIPLHLREIKLRLLSILDPMSFRHTEFKLISSSGKTYDLKPQGVYHIGTNELRIGLPEDLQPGSYQLMISPHLKDPFGQALDGNANGLAGDPFLKHIEITRSDQHPPVLREIHVTQSTVETGEKFTVQVSAYDRESYISEARVVFAKFDDSIEMTSVIFPKAPQDELEFSIHVHKQQDNGLFYLKRLMLKDPDGNIVEFEAKSFEDEPTWSPSGLPSILVHGGIDRDRTGPILRKLQVPDLGIMGSTISCDLHIIDYQSDLAAIEAEIQDESSFATVTFDAKWREVSSHHYQIDIKIPHYESRKSYFVSKIRLTDSVGNQTNYRADPVRKIFVGTTMKVPEIDIIKDADLDLRPPKLRTVLPKSFFVFQGETLEINLNIAGQSHPIEKIQAFMRNKLSVIVSSPEFKQVGQENYLISIPTSTAEEVGSYRLYKIEIVDRAGNRSVYQSMDPSESYYAGTMIPTVTVKIIPEDRMQPILHHIQLTMNHKQDPPMMTAKVTTDEGALIDYIDLSLSSRTNLEAGYWSKSDYHQLSKSTYALDIPLGNHFENDIFYVNFIVVADIYGNRTEYRASAGDEFFQGTTIPVPVYMSKP